MGLAGYAAQNGPKMQKAAGVLADSDGKLHDLTECAEEMYRTDKEWLQIAYLISRDLTKEGRDLVKKVAVMQWKRLKKA